MKKKFTAEFLSLTIGAVVLTILIVTGVFYNAFQQEIMNDLSTTAHSLAATGAFNDTENISYDTNETDLRITLIDEKGTVIYDNEANILDMDNHGARPEVEEAFKGGTGKDIRESATLNKNTYYYAVLLSNGHVLRVAKEARSLLSLYWSIIPIILLISICLVIIIMLLSHFLVKSIIRPIENLANNMGDIAHEETYEELEPFITTIVRQHEDLEKTSMMRQEFTANVSHELKTPLTSISGYSELIESGMASDENTARFAGEIHKNANRLLTLIDDTIRLSEMDVNVRAPEKENLDLGEIAKSVVSTLQVNAAKHEVSLNYEGGGSIISANRMMMEELIYNLTDNAIRYNNKGGSVTVSVTRTMMDRIDRKDYEVADLSERGRGITAAKKDDVVTMLSVEDTGIGIPKEHIKRIFERFYRVDKSRSKQTGGTGLGLAIVKHIAFSHNAEVLIGSKEGEGTRILVIFH